MCEAPNPNNEVIGMILYLDITEDLVDLVRKDIDANCRNGDAKGNKGSKKKKNKKDKISDFPKYNSPVCATIPARLLRIGDWEEISCSNSKISAKFFFTQKKIAWEIMTDDHMVHKLEMDYSSVAAIRATFNRDGPSVLELELDKAPSSYAFKLIHPRLARDWETVPDFTNWNAPTQRTHYVECPEKALEQPYRDLLNHDARLHDLSQKSFPSTTDSFFEANGLNHSNPITSQLPNGTGNYNNLIIPTQPAHLNIPVLPQLPNGTGNNSLIIPSQNDLWHPTSHNNRISSLLELLHNPTAQLPDVILNQLGHLNPTSSLTNVGTSYNLLIPSQLHHLNPSSNSLSNVGNNNHVLSHELDSLNLPPLLAPGFSQGGNLNPSSSNLVFPNSNLNPSSSQNISFPVPNSERNPSSNSDPSSSLNVAMTSNPNSAVNMRLNMPFQDLHAWDHTQLPSPDLSGLEGLAGLLEEDENREN